MKKDILEKVNDEINRYKRDLMSKVKEAGLWENFGSNEARKLENKYGKFRYDFEYQEAFKLIDDFRYWTQNYSPL